MDTSQPIPDIPLLEPWRPYDPVTATYDQRTNRNPNYWLEMDDETWQQHSQAMQQQVVAINTMQRPNLMVKYYSDLTT